MPGTIGTPAACIRRRASVLSPIDWIVSAGADHTVRLWDARTGEELLVLRAHSAPVTWVAFDPDGKRIVSTSSDITSSVADPHVRVWDATTGEELLTLRAHEDGHWISGVASAIFSPDGTRIISAGSTE